MGTWMDPYPSFSAARIARRAAIALATAALAACVTAPPAPQAVAALELPSEEAPGQSRVYEGIAVDEVLGAAKKVLRLAGYSVFPNPQGFVAVPPRVTLYPYFWPFGPAPWTFWTVGVAPGAEGVVVHADLRRHYGGPPYDPQGPAYSVVFDRLDYLLKRRATWTTCAEVAEGRFRPGWTPDASAVVHCFRRVPDERKPPGVRWLFDVVAEPDPDAPLPPAEPSEAEWLALTTRRYEGLAAGRVIDAAREALGRLHQDFAFRDLPDGLVAARRSTRVRYYLLVYTYEAVTHYWEVRVREADGAALASVYWTWGSKGESTVGVPGGGGGAEWDRLPGRPNWSKWAPDMAPYRHFWDCVDSVLASLPSCPAAP